MPFMYLFITFLAFFCRSSDSDFLSQADAEKILGQSAHRLYNKRGTGDGSTEKASLDVAYAANDTDQTVGKLGILYGLLQSFTDTVSAQARYTGIFEANSGHEGINVLEGVGDEAYFHSDGTNFLFIMSRKGTRVLTMKVNKITSHTSRQAFDEVARKIVANM